MARAGGGTRWKTRRARRRTASADSLSIRSVGIWRGAVAGSSYARSVASSAASVSLSIRSARFSGFFRSRSTAHDDAGLRAAEQLVSRERHDVGAGPDGLRHSRLAREPPGTEIEEAAGPEILEHRHPARPAELGQLRGGHALGEADDAVVG